MSGAFINDGGLSDISALSGWNTSNVTDMNRVFNGDGSLKSLHGLEKWDTSKVTNLEAIFANITNLTDASAIANWDTSNCTNMNDLFTNNKKLEYVDYSKWDFSKVASAVHGIVPANAQAVIYLGNNPTITGTKISSLGLDNCNHAIILSTGDTYHALIGLKNPQYDITINNGKGEKIDTIQVPAFFDSGNANTAAKAIANYKAMVDDTVNNYATEHNYVMIMTSKPGNTGVGNNNLITYAQAKYKALLKTTVTVGPGQPAVTYNGQTGQWQLSYFLPIIKDSKGNTISIPNGTLSISDFTFTKEGSSTPLTSEPTDPGTYNVALTSGGLTKLQNALPNYSIEMPVGSSTYTINKVNATATLSGQSSKTYDGKGSTPDQAGITVKVSYSIGNDQHSFAYHLQAGDYQWIKVNDDGSTTTLTGDAVDVGSYELTITPAGLNNIRAAIGNANVQLPATHLTGGVDFTIDKATPKALINISGSNSYDGKPIDFQPTIKIDAPGLTDAQKSIALTDGDYYLVKEGTTTKVDNPTNVGSYTIVLTDQGKAKVTNNSTNAANLDWAGVMNIPVTGSYQITQATNPITINLGKLTIDQTSNGQAARLSLDKLSQINDHLKSLGLNVPDSTDWTASDFQWGTADGTAPSKVGTYKINLSQAGLQKLKNLNPNYKLEIGSAATYNINGATQTIQYVDQNGKIIKTETIGQNDIHGMEYGTKLNFTPRLPDNYQLASPAPSQISIENGTTTIRIKPATESLTDTKTVTKTIHYRYADGRQAAADKQVSQSFSRAGTLNLLTGVTTWGSWEPATAMLGDVTSPIITGYTADQLVVPGQAVSADDDDFSMTVTYQKNKVPVVPDQPVTPDHPAKPVQPSQPAKPGNPGSASTGPNSASTPTSGLINGQSQAKSRKLPQTGNNYNHVAGLGLILASLSGMLGLAGLNKKREN